MPYEFIFSTEASHVQDVLATRQDFITEFIELLEQNKLKSIIGLGLSTGKHERLLEVPQRTVNITFPLTEYPVEEKKWVEASWAYEKIDMEDTNGHLVPTARVWCVTSCSNEEGCRSGYDHDALSNVSRYGDLS